MIEVVASGLLGTIVGGIFRLAPEILKFFDKKNERTHELDMVKATVDLEKTRGEIRVQERSIDFDVAQIEAIKEAYKADGEAAKASYPWVAALNALVRPLITYCLFFLYVIVKITFILHGIDMGSHWVDVLKANYGPDDFALLTSILSYWFLSRTLSKTGSTRA